MILAICSSTTWCVDMINWTLNCSKHTFKVRERNPTLWDTKDTAVCITLSYSKILSHKHTFHRDIYVNKNSQKQDLFLRHYPVHSFMGDWIVLLWSYSLPRQPSLHPVQHQCSIVTNSFTKGFLSTHEEDAQQEHYDCQCDINYSAYQCTDLIVGF